eukprot:TRINITY_DN30776_c0_g1_i1.p1 TRINITY_DN30776_c0_g1~~TRINITY_DN30776_c0_g1_i1.p1  ORF type:complete len:448 (-),score=62.13 TRINITY_DN30776_c0_g1_i1:14-1357(-)
MAGPLETPDLSYYSRFIEDRAVEVRWLGPGKGRGLFATRAFSKGEVVYRERPLATLQHQASRKEVIACGHCNRFLETPVAQLRHLLGPTVPEECFHLPCIKTQRPEAECACAACSEPVIPVQCPRCAEPYCSEECLSSATRSYHRLLCAALGENEALEEFILHSWDTNEMFLLVARIIATIICRWQEAAVADTIEAVEHLSVPFTKFCSVHWVDLVANSSASEERAADMAATRQVLLDSLQLLETALTAQLQAAGFSGVPKAISERFLTSDAYSHFMGMLERNMISIEITSPINRYLAVVNEFPAEQRVTFARQLLPIIEAARKLHDSRSHHHSECDTEEEEEEAEEEAPTPTDTLHVDSEYFPACSGAGLFALICAMNHSCVPNVTVEYDKDNTAIVRCVRPIALGEELCNSYIDEEELDLAGRQERLEDYGFVCTCARCTAEGGL